MQDPPNLSELPFQDLGVSQDLEFLDERLVVGHAKKDSCVLAVPRKDQRAPGRRDPIREGRDVGTKCRKRMDVLGSLAVDTRRWLR